MDSYLKTFKTILKTSKKMLHQSGSAETLEGFYFEDNLSDKEFEDLKEEAELLFENDVLKLPFKQCLFGVKSEEEDFALLFILKQKDGVVEFRTPFIARKGGDILEKMGLSDGEVMTFDMLQPDQPFAHVYVEGNSKGQKRIQTEEDSTMVEYMYYIAVAHIAQLHVGGFKAERKSTLAPGKAVAKRKRSKDDYFVVKMARPGSENAEDHKHATNNSPKLRPRLHMRRGHIRKQRVGVGRKELKEVFVRPCLVGHEEDGTIFRDLYEVG